jgi:hypothetical protein
LKHSKIYINQFRGIFAASNAAPPPCRAHKLYNKFSRNCRNNDNSPSKNAPRLYIKYFYCKAWLPLSCGASRKARRRSFIFLLVLGR